MSAPKLSAYIQQKIIPIIEKDIRDQLDTAIQSLEIPKEEIIPEMVKFFKDKGMTKSDANAILDLAIKSLDADSNFERAETSRPNVWVTKGFAPKAKGSKKTVGSRYAQFDRWKRKFSTDLMKTKYGKYFTEERFSGFLQLGHGATPDEANTRQTKTLAAVEQRRVKAYGKFQSDRAKIDGSAMQASKLIGILGQEANLTELSLQTTLKSLYTINGDIKRTGTVFLTLQAKTRNAAEKALEEAAQKRLIAELTQMALEAEGSPAPINWIDKYYDDLIIHGKKSKGVKSTAKTKHSIQPKTKAKRGKVPKLSPLRTKQGRFTSPVALMNLINARLHDVIKKNMGSPRLNYQTGRFARSVRVTNISQTRQQQMTAFYTYMKSPYQTFERGHAQGSYQRDPRRLISQSIREAAAAIMQGRFEIRTRRQ